MQGVKKFIIISQRSYVEDYDAFFRDNKVDFYLKSFCKGTTSRRNQEIWGVESADKVLYEGLIREEEVEDFKVKLKKETNVTETGMGIVFFIPVDSIGGMKSKDVLLGEKPLIKKEGNENMESLSKNVLITVITDCGYSEQVMDLAREAGATGGTVAKANGTGYNMAKFFGVTISKEKDMLYIVCKRENRDAIMHAIMDKLGNDSPAHTTLYSLPVDGVLGIRSLEN